MTIDSIQLKYVTLRNFRCFERLDIELHSRLTVIVGENGAGKTAILDGIAAGLGPILARLSSADQRLSISGAGIDDLDFRLVRREKHSKDRWVTSNYCQVALESIEGMRWDVSRSSTKASGKRPEERLGRAELFAYLENIEESLKSEARKLLPVFAYYGSQRGKIEVPQRLWVTKENYEHPTSALYEALKSSSNFKEMLKWFDHEEASELRANKGRRIEDFEFSKALDGVRAVTRTLLSDNYSSPRFDESHRFVVDSPEGIPLQVSQLSQGYQSMLALGMDFARRLALANSHLEIDRGDPTLGELMRIAVDNGAETPFTTNHVPHLFAPALMLIDEIELHLHPSWQQKVLRDLMRAFPNTQFVVTSHSAPIISTVPSECVRVLSEGMLHSVHGTEGAEASRILKRVFNVESRPPNNEVTKKLNKYLGLIQDDLWDTEQAAALRMELDQYYQGEEPALVDADLLIENKKWELDQ